MGPRQWADVVPNSWDHVGPRGTTSVIQTETPGISTYYGYLCEYLSRDHVDPPNTHFDVVPPLGTTWDHVGTTSAKYVTK